MKILTWHRLDNVLTTLIIIVILKFLSVFYNIDFLDPVQNFIQDLQLSDVYFSKFRDLGAIKKDTNIVIVNIGYLNREGIAEELDIVNRYKPKVIGIDAFFLNRKTAKLDTPLVDAMSRVKNLVLTSKIAGYDEVQDKFDTLVTSNEIFNKYAKTGFANFPNEEEFVKTTRRFVPVVDLAKGKEYSFAVRIVKDYDSVAFAKLLKRDNESEIINFRRNLDKYTVLDVDDVFGKSDSLAFLKGKIILLGFVGPDTSTKVSQDNFITPMNRQYIGKAFPDMYGVVIHANIISMLLDGHYINSMPYWLTTAITVLLIYLLMEILLFIRYKYEEWYEAVELLVLTGFLFGTFLVTLYSLKWFHYNMELQAIVFVLIVAEIVFESYHGSLKPLGISLFIRVRNLFSKIKKPLPVTAEEENGELNFKKILIDTFLSTTFVFVGLLLIPLIFSGRIYQPYWDAVNDFKLTDIGFAQISHPETNPPDTNIVIVNIEGISKFKLAKLIDMMNQYKPKVIGIDKIFKEDKNSSADSVLISSLSKTKNLVLACKLRFKTNSLRNFTIRSSPPEYTHLFKQGFNNIVISGRQNYSTVRDFLPGIEDKNGMMYSFPLLIAKSANPVAAENFIKRNNKIETINWSDYKRFISVDYVDVFIQPDLLADLSNKIVLLGDYDPRDDPEKYPFVLRDKYFTPLNPNFMGRTYPDMYDINIQASIISMILQGKFLYTVPAWLDFLLSYVLCFVIILVFLLIKAKIDTWYELLSVFVFVVESMLILVATIFFFHYLKIDLNLNLALISIAVAAPIFEAYEKSVKPLSLEFYHRLTGKKKIKVKRNS